MMKIKILEVPNELIEIAAKFKQSAMAADELIFPMLCAQEITIWEPIHSLLLNLIIEGNDIAKKAQVYCVIGKIPSGAARDVTNMVSEHVSDLELIFLSKDENLNSEDIRDTLMQLFNVSNELTNAFRTMIHEQFLT